jgi:predicted MPP superfamily phosphohydrolase
LRFLKFLPDVLVAGTAIACFSFLLFRRWRDLSAPQRATRALLLLALSALLLTGAALTGMRVWLMFPNLWSSWIRALAIMVAFITIPATALKILLDTWQQRTNQPRRALLHTAALALPAATLGYGVFIERERFRLREIDIPIPRLPRELHGLRIVQLTDMHCSPFLSPRDLERAVHIANDTRAHLALVTGDLITTGRDPLDGCMDVLSKLKADAGIYGCMGNHETYASAENYVDQRGRRLGMRFLRDSRALLTFSGKTINLAGVDYQQFLRPYLIGAERLADPTASVNILLSHNPDVFPTAARKGFDLTISGHTHGGQVTVEILRQHANVARFFTPYVDGLYQENEKAVYVSRGIGTIGLPARICAPPEVSLIRLCAT